MSPADRDKLRQFLQQCLGEAGDTEALADGDSLFVSGRLDSLALTRVVLFVEAEFGIDFGRLDFSAELIDSVDLIAALTMPQQSAPARA